MGKIARDPAILLTLIATIVRLAVAHFIDPTPDQQTIADALITAVAGFVVAFFVQHEKQVPALLGLVQAAIAVAINMGFNIDAATQAAIMSVVGGLAALFVRTQVVAPVPAHPEVLGRRV